MNPVGRVLFSILLFSITVLELGCAPLEKREAALSDAERVALARDVISNYPGWVTQWVCVGRSLPNSNEFLGAAFQVREDGSARINVGPIVVEDSKNISSKISSLEVTADMQSKNVGIKYFLKRKRDTDPQSLEPIAIYSAQGYLQLHSHRVSGKSVGIDCASARLDQSPQNALSNR